MQSLRRALLAVAVAAVLADRQGYTPYGYGVDTPVLKRASVSYGRGWQLLRSRGENSNATGPCDPPQQSWSCSGCLASSDADDALPQCITTAACASTYTPPLEPPRPPPAKAAILFVLDANASNLRFYYGRAVRKVYASQLGLLVRAVMSLRRVNTTLPIKLLLSGSERLPTVEARLEQLGVGILGPERVPPVRVPSWGSKWARGSFAKLRALALPPDEYERVIVLDSDTVVLRNIDHLASPPFEAPAAVVQYKCFPRAELRAALLVLRPAMADWTRALALLANKATGVYDDLGEGSVWRHLYGRVHELPIGYAALRSSDLPAAEWAKVHVLHDPNLLRKAGRAGWKEAQMEEAALKPINALQMAEMRDGIGPLLAAATPPPKPKAKPKKRKARGKRRARVTRL